MSKYDGYLRHELLTLEEETELGERAMEGDPVAICSLVVRNLRFVFSIATRVSEKYSGPLSFDDILSEGTMGMMRAAEKFNPERGRFATYAAWWVKQAIRKSILEEESQVRIPATVGRHRKRLRAVMETFKEENGFYPTAKEASRFFEDVPTRRILVLMDVSGSVSLDMPLSDGEKDSVGEIVGDQGALSPDEEAHRNMLPEEVERLLEALDERETRIVRQRYGLDGGPVRTLESLSDEMGLTRERIRQIQERALGKMRKKMD